LLFVVFAEAWKTTINFVVRLDSLTTS